MTTKSSGGCDCGRIRYTFSGELLSCYTCHCTDCQTRSGAAFTLSGVITRDQLETVEGTVADYAAKFGTVNFCAACAVQLWVIPDVAPSIVLIRLGTLDDTSRVTPVAHIWTRSAQPWVVLGADTAKFEEAPEDPMILLELWRNRKSS